MRGRILALSCGLLLVACSPPPPSPEAAACTLTTGPLPRWARAGFAPPDQTVSYALGAQGDILGVVFAHPLQVPSPPERDNKILWVSKEDSRGPLWIDGTLAGSGRTWAQEVPDGPGPSIVDVPAPGCWSFQLSWDGHHDQVSLAYLPG